MKRITEALKGIIEKEGKTVYRVAKDIGVDFSSLYRALGKEGNLGAKTIDKIMDYLGYEVKFIKRKDVKSAKSMLSKSRRDKREEQT